MRLKSIWISDYKNLKDFALSFNDSKLIEIFVGTNGTGKSNVFEALLEIFRNLFEWDTTNEFLPFDYEIIYEVDGKEVHIESRANQLKINGAERKTIGATPVPENVLCYYSGHNETVTKLTAQYKDDFRKKLRGATEGTSRKFIGITPDYKEFLLSMLLLQPEESKSREYICKKLGIETCSSELKIVLSRPFYAQNDSNYDIEVDEGEARFWHAEGIVRTFLTALSTCTSEQAEKELKFSGYMANDDNYVFYLDCEKVRKEFSYNYPDLFRKFDNLKTLGMLQELSLNLTLDSSAHTNLSTFSDGQFQSVYIYALVELFKDKNCLTLLDEPDSFLHPEWQFDFLNQLSEITAEDVSKNHILMCSHSGATLASHPSKKVKLLQRVKEKVSCIEIPRHIAIQKLSNSLLYYSKEKQLLSILSDINNHSKPILITEGQTDASIIETAWYKLNAREMPFTPFFAFGCGYIKQLLANPLIHQELDGRPLFALYDFDEAFAHWNALGGDTISNDLSKGLIRKCQHGNSFAILLPIPAHPKIQCQVIKDPTKGEHFGADSCCEIEHLFYGINGLDKYYQKEVQPGGGEFITFSASKEEFAKEVVPQLPDKHFKVFKPIFDFITAQINAI